MQEAQVLESVRSAVLSQIVAPIVALLFIIALILFLWGLVKFIAKASSEEARSKGKQHMIYGVIGMAIMLGAFGIVKFVFNTVADFGGGTDIEGKPLKPPATVERGFQ
jgi:hypothetical protein